MYVPDQYRTQNMCDRVILENVPKCYKNQELCNKAVDNYVH